MKKTLQKNTYTQLVVDITELYGRASRALVEAYWRIGKRIVEQEQLGEANAVYGDHLLSRLSEDLSEALGSGFSKRNLYNMRRFYLAHEENLQHTAKLTWTQHVALLPVKNGTTRRRLERKIVNQKLSYEQIRHSVHELNQASRKSSEIRTTAVPSLACVRGPVHSFALVDKARATYPRGMVVVDCGFNIWRRVSREQMPSVGEASYTYPARVESVIDGDTIWAVIDCGFDTFVREKLRFHKIDTPELGTAQGEKASRYVKRVLMSSPHIVVRTHLYDKYARYLADIFYLPGVTAYERIASEGLHLNQELLDKGLAKAMH